MANESTYAGIDDLVASVYETALMVAQEGNVIAPFVTVFDDTQSQVPRIFGSYSGGTFLAVAESADSANQAFNADPAGTLTPAVLSSMVTLTERRLRTDPSNAVREAGVYLGQTASAKIDTDLASLFASLTGGTVGTAGGTLTWANIMRAQAYIRSNKVFGSYACVLHPVQWYYLTSATSGVPTLMQNTSIAESIVGNFYQASFGGIDFFCDANITSGTAAVGAMFAKPAMALDLRQAFSIERQRDASWSGNGAWELVASMDYGYGVFRPTYGVICKGTSA
jgi:hypothetical protein